MSDEGLRRSWKAKYLGVAFTAALESPLSPANTPRVSTWQAASLSRAAAVYALGVEH
jgi:hypothetical protein